jgi:hypothetical protein
MIQASLVHLFLALFASSALTSMAFGSICDLNLSKPNFENLKHNPPKENQIYEMQIAQGQTFEEYSLSIARRSSRDLVEKSDGTHLVIIQGSTYRNMRISVTEHENFFIETIRPVLRTEKLPSYDRMLTPDEVKEFSYLRRDPDYNYHHSAVDLQGYAVLKDKIIETLDFTMKRYREEKGEWPPQSMLRKLVHIAFRYALDSTLISIREKKPDGTMGKIIGTVRSIAVPYVDMAAIPDYDGVADPRTLSRAKELLSNEVSLFSRGVELDFNQDAFANREVWKEIFGADKVQMTPQDLAPLPVRIDGTLAYIPAPFELVFNKDYVRERNEAKSGLQYFIEPGNFAILPARDLPTNLHGYVAAGLYFHLARVIRKESGAAGSATHVGTWASVRSTSDRFYQSLGFAPKELFRASENQTPTPKDWNILMGGEKVLETALLNRFGNKVSSEHITKIFRIHDQFESKPLPKKYIKTGRFLMIDDHEHPDKPYYPRTASPPNQ